MWLLWAWAPSLRLGRGEVLSWPHWACEDSEVEHTKGQKVLLLQQKTQEPGRVSSGVDLWHRCCSLCQGGRVLCREGGRRTLPVCSLMAVGRRRFSVSELDFFSQWASAGQRECRGWSWASWIPQVLQRPCTVEGTSGAWLSEVGRGEGLQSSAWQAVFTGLLSWVDHRRGSWGSAKELGYQECRKKQALCQDVGVKPRTAEQSRRVESQQSQSIRMPSW